MDTAHAGWLDGVPAPAEDWEIDGGLLTLVHGPAADDALAALRTSDAGVDALFAAVENGAIVTIGRAASPVRNHPLTAMTRRNVDSIVLAALPTDLEDRYPEPFMIAEVYNGYGHRRDVEVHYTPSWIIQFVYSR